MKKIDKDEMISKMVMDKLIDNYKGHESEFWDISKLNEEIISERKAEIYIYRYGNNRPKGIRKIRVFSKKSLCNKINKNIKSIVIKMYKHNESTKKIIDLKNQFKTIDIINILER